MAKMKSPGFWSCFIWKGLSQLVGHNYFCLEKKEINLTEVQSQRGGNERTCVFLWLAGHLLFDRLFIVAWTCDGFRPLLYCWLHTFSFSPSSPSQAIWSWGKVPDFLARTLPGNGSSSPLTSSTSHRSKS